MSGTRQPETHVTKIQAGASLEAWSSHDWKNGIQVDRLNDLEQLVVKTQNSTYEITVISGKDGDILVRGGRFFPQRFPALLSGASLGGSFLKLRGIYTGLRMEIVHEGRCIVTSPVCSIAAVL